MARQSRKRASVPISFSWDFTDTDHFLRSTTGQKLCSRPRRLFWERGTPSPTSNRGSHLRHRPCCTAVAASAAMTQGQEVTRHHHVFLCSRSTMISLVFHV